MPLADRLRDDPASRLAVLLVLADGCVVHDDALNRPSPEPDDVAATLLAGLQAAAERAGGLPRRLLVRDSEIAAALTRRLGETALVQRPVVEAGALDQLDDLGSFLIKQATGPRSRCYVTSPQTWAGWDVPAEQVAELFRAPAAFHRAAPWRVMAEAGFFAAGTPTGQTWIVSMLGDTEEEAGLTLYSSALDLWRTAVTTPKTTALQGRIVAGT